jgi:hypothetical protein
MFSVHYCVFPSLPHPRSERLQQQQQQSAQKMRHAKRSIIRHMPIYPACMPIYLIGGERHDLFNRYEPQILRTVHKGVRDSFSCIIIPTYDKLNCVSCWNTVTHFLQCVARVCVGRGTPPVNNYNCAPRPHVQYHTC